MSIIFIKYTGTLSPMEYFLPNVEIFFTWKTRTVKDEPKERVVVFFSYVGFFFSYVNSNEWSWQPLPSPRAQGLQEEVGRVLSDIPDTSHQHLLIYDSPGLELWETERVWACMYERTYVCESEKNEEEVKKMLQKNVWKISILLGHIWD